MHRSWTRIFTAACMVITTQSAWAQQEALKVTAPVNKAMAVTNPTIAKADTSLAKTKTVMVNGKQKEIKIIDDDGVYLVPDVMPEYPGGTQALQSYLGGNARYPKIAQRWNVGGIVLVSFVINEDGTVSNARIARDAAPLPSKKRHKESAEELYERQIGQAKAIDACAREALRLIKNMPAWQPGKAGGRPVKVRYNIPVNYKMK